MIEIICMVVIAYGYNQGIINGYVLGTLSKMVMTIVTGA